MLNSRLLLVLIFLFFAVLTGCGGGSNDSVNSLPVSSDPAPDNSTPMVKAE